MDNVCDYGSFVLGIVRDDLFTHILYNKVFNYYVCTYRDHIDELNTDFYMALYNDYFPIEELIMEQKLIQKDDVILCTDVIEPSLCKTLFYNDFDIKNKKIKKFLEELKKLPFLWSSALNVVREFAVLNIDRKPLKESFMNVESLKGDDLTEFFEIMDSAMDEMPSGVLNGMSVNGLKDCKLKNEANKYKKSLEYVKQTDACLSRKDAKLFYKLYFALLEFTNGKYKVQPNVKIYNKKNINPYDIIDVIDAFWENRDVVVLEFCLANPYKFTNE